MKKQLRFGFRLFVLSVAVYMMIPSLSLVAQVHHPWQLDGQIYFKLKNDFKFEVRHTEGKVDLKEMQGLLGHLYAKYEVHKLEKPFWSTTSFELQRTYQLYFQKIHQIDELIKEMEQLSFIEYAEPVPLMKTTLTPNDLGANSTSGTGQWHLHKIQAPQAWDLSVGSPSIVVGIVDDAVLTTHPDLSPVCLPGRDVADNDNDPNPPTSSYSHGTHVAGISGAATNNGIGVASIGFGVKILPVKATNSASAVTHGYPGVTWAADNGAHIINCSWGGPTGGTTGQNVINYAWNKGCIIVAAAGNDNTNQQFFPAAYNNVISVASTASSDAKSSFSNYGTWIDISAPGSAIYSTYVGGSSTPTATYSRIQGTSMASPLVAGLLALMKSFAPTATRNDLINCLYSSADNINAQNSNFIGQLGAGRINAYQALVCLQQFANAAPIANFTADVTSGCPGLQVQFNAFSTGGAATSYAWQFPGGTPSTSTLQNPVVTYSNIGTYNVVLTMTNLNGSHTRTENNYITISNSGIQTIFLENFESGNLNGWTVENPDNGITWVNSQVGGTNGGSRAAGINLWNYSNAIGQRDRLISPVIDLSGSTNIELKFDHAHRRYSQNERDSLVIYASSNGGTSWNRIFAQAENGTGNFATNSTTTANFVPADIADWCYGGTIGAQCFTINLGAYSGVSNFRLRFESVNAYGNNLYLDNIRVTGTCQSVTVQPPIASFNASQTNICEGDLVSFSSTSLNSPTAFSWSFPGGTPSSSSSANPSISYNTPGTYNVSLTVSNTAGSNTATINSYIVVNPLPPVPVITQVGDSLIGSPGYASYLWRRNGFTVGTTQAIQITQTGTYELEVRDSNDCSNVSAELEINQIGNTAVINELENAQILLYPNPASEFVVLDFSLLNFDIQGVDVFNALGEQIYSFNAEYLQNNKIYVNVAALAGGVYMARISSTGGLIARKFIVSK